ncbi:sugar transferase [Streptomyces sp. NPDC058279]|uniref:sugar transferase n=1 Tax=Streptomyces sp. NPDC058279 TaxID=3346418 RepID=UPI0036E7B9A3
MPLPPRTLPALRRPAWSPPRPDLSAKRVLDLLGALLLSVVVAVPLLSAVGLLYAAGWAAGAGRRGTPGPRVLVREPAAGLGGRPFRTWRLRTENAGRAGEFVERCALDALPQLLNVLRGEMSLVGPRPEAGVDRADRLHVRPGMTGLWQVSARSDLPWEEMALLDRHYVESHWLGMDLAILARTPRAAYRQRHA